MTVERETVERATVDIRLRSHVGLHLDHGATVLAADPGGGRGYDPAELGPGNESRRAAPSCVMRCSTTLFLHAAPRRCVALNGQT